MKWIKYMQYIGQRNIGTEEEPVYEDVFQEVGVEYNGADIERIKDCAYNGEYEIYDDGEPEPVVEPTQADRIEAQVTYTAMMTDTLLEV